MSIEDRFVEGVFPPRFTGPQPKPVRGESKMARKISRAAIEREEEKHKAKAKKRDGKCRLPFCPWCAAFPDQVHAGAHVLHAKGIGGDRSLDVSTPDHLMRLCHLSHCAQENHDWAVEPLTEVLCDGPCEFYLVQDVIDAVTGLRRTERVLWAREIRIGVPDSAAPYTTWTPIWKPTAQD